MDTANIDAELEQRPLSQSEVWELADELLRRWHRWTASPMQSTDHLMREFDQLLSSMRPCLQCVLVLEARNLVCGAAVYTSVRMRGYKTRLRARRELRRVLEASPKWAGHHLVTLNENGRRIGESNPMARLTDHEVALLREMRDERRPDGSRRYSLMDLARHFKQPRSTIADICSYRRRAQTIAVVKEE